MAKNKRDIYDRKFFGFRDQLAPRYGYENAKKLAYAFIKLLRKYRNYCDINWDVYNLRCCNAENLIDLNKYRALQNSKQYNGVCKVDELTTISGIAFMIGFDYGFD